LIKAFHPLLLLFKLLDEFLNGRLDPTTEAAAAVAALKYF